AIHTLEGGQFLLDIGPASGKARSPSRPHYFNMTNQASHYPEHCLAQEGEISLPLIGVPPAEGQGNGAPRPFLHNGARDGGADEARSEQSDHLLFSGKARSLTLDDNHGSRLAKYSTSVLSGERSTTKKRGFP